MPAVIYDGDTAFISVNALAAHLTETIDFGNMLADMTLTGQDLQSAHDIMEGFAMVRDSLPAIVESLAD